MTAADRAKRTLARFAVLNAPKALVRRDGADLQCAVGDVVLDDVLVLHPGGQIVADAELIDCRELEVDEALLTGEADLVTAAVGREMLSGSTVVAGSGLARVIRVGGNSYSAQITAEAKQFSIVRSELRDSVARIIRWISVGLIPVGALIVNGQMQAAGGWSVAVSSGAWKGAAVAAAGSIMAMVPQGLVFLTSLALTVGAVKLARRRVLVHELAAVEGLARFDMLCVDKTGTLTDGSLALDRTIVLAHSPHPLEPRGPGEAPLLPDELEPVALIVLRERVRADAAETLGYFSQQGVQVCIISGDDPLTVGAHCNRSDTPLR